MKYSVVDGHLDLLLFVSDYRNKGQINVIQKYFLPSIQAGNVRLIVASIFVEDIFLPEMGLRKSLDQISMMLEELSDTDEFVLCKDWSMISETLESGRLAFLLSMEGADALGNDPHLLRVFHELGVRLLGLTWSRRNYLGDGSFYRPVVEGRKGGLTPFGLQVVQKAGELGMILDCSHLNDEGFEDLLRFSDGPVIASHSNARAVTPSLRNLTDEQIKALSYRDGVIGVNAVNFFVGANDDEATQDQLLNHLDHIVDIGGVDHVGFGFDFCGVLKNQLSSETHKSFPRPHFDVIPGYEAMPHLLDQLEKRGYQEDQIRKISGANWLRVFQRL